jgi:hypothetical protein
VHPAKLTAMTEEQLLATRLCDLPLQIEGTQIEPRIEQLHEELAARGIDFRPHCWLSEEWFSPDGVPGIAIPFYLAHPRLMRLERKQMLEVEGGTHEWCMKILRHEAGHAIDTAYRIRRKREFREIFGPASRPYPEFYQPKPFSKSYVLHLDMWYAQSHPVEDFAETFAVWLRAGSRWRSRYAGWPALKKLEFVDRLMLELCSQKPVVRSRLRIEPLKELRKTIGQHYKKKREHYGMDFPGFYDGDLRRLFSAAPEYRTNVAAATFLQRVRGELRRAVARWTGEYQYTIDQVISEMINRCRQLRLRLIFSEAETKQELLILLTVQTMNYLHGGNHRVAL